MLRAQTVPTVIQAIPHLPQTLLVEDYFAAIALLEVKKSAFFSWSAALALLLPRAFIGVFEHWNLISVILRQQFLLQTISFWNGPSIDIKLQDREHDPWMKQGSNIRGSKRIRQVGPDTSVTNQMHCWSTETNKFVNSFMLLHKLGSWAVPGGPMACFIAESAYDWGSWTNGCVLSEGWV
jgi:hypothetical protein